MGAPAPTCDPQAAVSHPKGSQVRKGLEVQTPRSPHPHAVVWQHCCNLWPKGCTTFCKATTAPAKRPGGHSLAEGVHDILQAYDHLAFLLALLLPISLVRQPLPRSPQPMTKQLPASRTTDALDRRTGLKALLLTVTLFTLGHSVTLALAGLGWVTVSGNWVEPAIAISIGISALLNLFPVRGLRGHWLALGFGLIHGLGFSGVLVEAGISGISLVWALAGFNLGVEAGRALVA